MVFALSLLVLCAVADTGGATRPVVPTTTSAPEGGVPLAVLPLRAEGLQLNEAQRLDGLIRTRGATVGGYRVQTADETTALLEAAQALGVRCDLGDPACGGQIGMVAAVDRVVVGRAARVAAVDGNADGVGVEVVLVEAATGSVLRRAIALLPVEPAAQTAAFEGVARVLFAADGAAPWLVISGGQAGARVVVDGIDVGALPFARPLAGVVAGRHVLEVRARGFLPWRSVITTAGVDPAVVDVQLVVDPSSQREVVSPGQIAVAWGTAGTGAAVLVTGAVVGVIAAQPWFAFQATEARYRKLDPEDPDYVTRAAALHDDAVKAQDAWQENGLLWTTIGLTAAAAGLVAGVGGTVWAMTLSRSDGVSETGPAVAGAASSSSSSSSSSTTPAAATTPSSTTTAP